MPANPAHHHRARRTAATLLTTLILLLTSTATLHASEANFGVNLVQNGDFESSGQKWTYPSGTSISFTSGGQPDGIGRYFVTAYGEATIYQDIKLTNFFTQSERSERLVADVSCDYFVRNYLLRQEMCVQFLDAAGTVLSEEKPLSRQNDEATLEPTPWTTCAAALEVPSGTVTIRVNLTSAGRNSLNINYVGGPGFDNVSVKLRRATDTPTYCRATVVTNKQNEEGVVGAEQYLQGSTIFIYTTHNEADHYCLNTFKGYDGETDADLTTTQRRITLNEDQTLTALFETKKVHYEDNYFKLPWNFADTFVEPEIVKPEGFSGEPTYTSSDPTLATVSADGKVTYVGNGKTGTVSITATFSEEQEANYAIEYDYALFLNQTPAAGGTLSYEQVGEYASDGYYMITATPADGFITDTWQTDSKAFVVEQTENTITVVHYQDETITANFRKLNTAEFSKTEYVVREGQEAEFTAPTLTFPSDYTGTPAYSSSNTDAIMVNETTGKLTFFSWKDSSGDVIITATLPDDGNYRATTLSYSIEYVRSNGYGINLIGSDSNNWDREAGQYFPRFCWGTRAVSAAPLPNGDRYFSGFRGTRLAQTVNLKQSFTTEELATQPKVLFSFDHSVFNYSLARAVRLRYLDADGNEIQTVTLLDETFDENTLQLQPWTTTQFTGVLPAGATQIKAEVLSSGTTELTEKYNTLPQGPAFAHFQLVLVPADSIVETCTITTALSQELEGEAISAGGKFWKGSTVLIGCSHDMPLHPADEYEFGGYQEEETPIVSTTQRYVEVTEDATYTAILRQMPVASFDDEDGIITIERDNAEEEWEAPELLLPDDWDGNQWDITYSSSNTDLATVDDEGDVTYVGNVIDGLGSVTITAHLPATNRYCQADVSYDVVYWSKWGNELVKNGDFSEGSSDLNSNAAHWTFSSLSRVTMVRWNSDPAASVLGYSLHMHLGYTDMQQDVDSTDNRTPSTTFGPTYQDIDLLAAGYTEDDLDDAPKLFASCDIQHPGGYACAKVAFHCYDADGKTLDTFTLIDKEPGDYSNDRQGWYTLQKTFDLPEGTRSVRVVLLGGLSDKNLVSEAHLCYDNVSLRLHASTAKYQRTRITTTTNTYDGVEHASGTGTYYKGTYVLISTTHSHHNCLYDFKGWKGETNPDVKTSTRRILVPATDTTFTATFGDRYIPHVYLQKTSYGVYTGDGNVAPINIMKTIKGLPQGYVGTFTFKSSNESIAKVSADGIVTFCGDKSKEGLVSILVDVPAWGDSLTEKSTLECLIVYASRKHTITSKSDFKTFASKYDDKWVIATLDCDFTFNTYDEEDQMDYFKGYFDGQGHKIEVTFNDQKLFEFYGPFRHATGVFKKLNLTGKATDSGNNTHRYYTPLIVEAWQREVTGYTDLLIEQCNSKFKYSASGWYADYVGGFVAYTFQAKVVFRDCSYTGTLSSDDCGFVGGYLGNVGEGSTVELYNCFSDLTGSTSSPLFDSDYPAYFLGNPKGYSSIKTSQSNCYVRTYKSSKCAAVRNNVDASYVDDAQLTSGEVTFNLNRGRAGIDAVFKQTIHTDKLPQLGWLNTKSKEVFRGAGVTFETGEKGWTTFIYPARIALEKWPDVRAFTVNSVEKDGNLFYLTLNEYTEAELQDRIPYILSTLTDLKENTTVVPLQLPLPLYYYNKPLYSSRNLPLVGVYQDTIPQTGSFLLKEKEGLRPAFYRTTDRSEEFKVPRFHCYLSFDSSEECSNASKIYLIFAEDDEPTDIEDNPMSPVERLKADGPVYDTLGRRVQTLQPGQLYIKNGQKFMIK